MKQKHLTLAALAILCGTALFSCSSDDNESPKAPTTFHMTVNATKGTNNALLAPAVSPTRALSLNGSTLKATWSTTEQVFVQAVTQEGLGSLFWFGGHLSPQSNAKSTTLSGTISLPSGWKYESIQNAIGNTVSDVFTLQFPRKEWEYTDQKGTLADIAQNYDYAIAANIRVSISENKIEGTAELVDFENQQAIVKFTLKDSGGNPINASSLTISAAGLAESVSLWYNSERHRYEPYNIPENDPGSITISLSPATSVVYAALRGIDDVPVTLTATVGKDTYTYTTRNNVTFEHGEYYEISVKMTKQ